jgi:long-chain acyl-CoA synthetase
MSRARPTSSRRGLRLGRRTFPVVPAAQPRLRAYRRAAFPDRLGAQIYYAEGLEKLAANIEETRPTIMVVVPRLFEMLRTRILKQVEKRRSGQYLLDRALEIESRRNTRGRSPGDCRWTGCRSDLAPQRWRQVRRAGQGLVSGGAPLNPEVGLFFQSMGLVMLQGYGQTEAGR